MTKPALSEIPAIDRLLSEPGARAMIDKYGHQRVTSAFRTEIGHIREAVLATDAPVPSLAVILDRVNAKLALESESTLKSVINLTGTVLHTNLGRAHLPAAAIERIASVAAGASNLEFDLETGRRGDRDSHIEGLLREITGAEAVTVVNNNAAAVLLALNTLAFNKEVPVSRGELVEIGGSFRIPEIMSRAGCYLVEVGATNRTHLHDYERMIGEHTALLMKVHTSNYEITGFTSAVSEASLAELARERGIPLLTDLGSGTLVDLTRYGLPFEPTVQSVLASGADLVTFSGDKLLGGPQAGIIAGRADLIDRIKQNPMKRALRVDKMTLAALFEVLKLYRDPDSLPTHLPTLRILTRPVAEIKALAETIAPGLAKTLDGLASVTVVACESQIGSGALPTSRLPGFALSIAPVEKSEQALQALVTAFRQLPLPVLGRINDGTLIFDLRTLETPQTFTDQMGSLELP